jgi:ATP-dependent DNA helicase RecQ
VSVVPELLYERPPLYPAQEAAIFTEQWHGDAAPSDSSSGPMVAHLQTAIRLDTASAIPDGAVLLCAVSTRTGWTLTVAAALLHEAGVRQVMPLVLHKRP